MPPLITYPKNTYFHHHKWQPSVQVKIVPRMGLAFGFGALWRPLNGSRTPEMDPKLSLQLPLIDLSPFPGSLIIVIIIVMAIIKMIGIISPTCQWMWGSPWKSDHLRSLHRPSPRCPPTLAPACHDHHAADCFGRAGRGSDRVPQLIQIQTKL